MSEKPMLFKQIVTFRESLPVDLLLQKWNPDLPASILEDMVPTVFKFNGISSLDELEDGQDIVIPSIVPPGQTPREWRKSQDDRPKRQRFQIQEAELEAPEESSSIAFSALLARPEEDEDAVWIGAEPEEAEDLTGGVEDAEVFEDFSEESWENSENGWETSQDSPEAFPPRSRGPASLFPATKPGLKPVPGRPLPGVTGPTSPVPAPTPLERSFSAKAPAPSIRPGGVRPLALKPRHTSTPNIPRPTRPPASKFSSMSSAVRPPSSLAPSAPSRRTLAGGGRAPVPPQAPPLSGGKAPIPQKGWGGSIQQIRQEGMGPWKARNQEGESLAGSEVKEQFQKRLQQRMIPSPRPLRLSLDKKPPV